MSRTEYTVVIATRNRTAALALSLPLLLAQSPAPREILVVDSSEEPGPTRRLIDDLSRRTRIPIHHILSERGSAYQRNVGLARVRTEVVFFPDDDSLVYPGALDAMMRIYDLDRDGIVGGVCTAEAKTAPQVGGTSTVGQYRMTLGDRLKAKFAVQRARLEQRLARDPFETAAERRQARLPPLPEWLEAENAKPVYWMTGFRMSFRTHVIRRIGFNENLGHYALGEDIEASLTTQGTHYLIGARNAKIHHYKVPQRRGNGRALGGMQILNRAYILARLGQTDARIRSEMTRLALFRMAQYLLGTRSAFGRERLAGAWAAFRMVPALFDALPAELDGTYADLRRKVFSDNESLTPLKPVIHEAIEEKQAA
ncbi:glycosyltransferase family 2 protein [Rubellimicrobium arenae]|uniref:glycosyltransferase family 2 protein n=1 Tax=Rubellimicrobium arenae TaxID=2817372 RepID=UPI001B315C3B